MLYSSYFFDLRLNYILPVHEAVHDFVQLSLILLETSAQNLCPVGLSTILFQEKSHHLYFFASIVQTGYMYDSMHCAVVVLHKFRTNFIHSVGTSSLHSIALNVT